MVAAWFVAVSAFQRYREGVPRARWLDVLYDSHSELSRIAPALTKDSGSLSAAGTLLAMIKARTRMTAFAATAFFCVPFVGLIFLVLKSDQHPLPGLFVLTPTFGAFVGVMIGLTLGAEFWVTQPPGPRPGTLRTYLATLPLSDQQLGLIVLRSLVPGLLMAWCCLLISLVLGGTIHGVLFGPPNSTP